MRDIPVPDPAQIRLGQTNPATGRPWHLGDVVKYLLATSPTIRAKNVKQLSEELGLSYTVVRQWYREGTSPNLENLTVICERLNTTPVQFFLQWGPFNQTLAQRHGAVFDRIASVLVRPENAHKLLAILLEVHKLGLLESFLEYKGAELGVTPDHPVRSIERTAPSRKKSRKGA